MSTSTETQIEGGTMRFPSLRTSDPFSSTGEAYCVPSMFCSESEDAGNPQEGDCEFYPEYSRKTAECDESSPPMKKWLCFSLKFLRGLGTCAWNLAAEIARFVGLGRNPSTCVTLRQRLWLWINCRILEQSTRVTTNPRVADELQAKLFLEYIDNAHDINEATFLRCSTLQKLKEPVFVWDAFQRLTFIASSGHFWAERHAAITRDGHLLILHRIVRVPKNVSNRLVPMESISAARVLAFLIFHKIARIVKGLRRRLQGSAILSDTATSTPLPIKNLINIQCTQSMQPSTLWKDGNTRSPSLAKVVIFQHGLLESSGNWLAAAAPTDMGVPYSLNPICLYQIAWAEVQDIFRMVVRALCNGDPFGGLPHPTRPDQSLSHALPFNLILRGEMNAKLNAETALRLKTRFDVWLGNTRGNCYSRFPCHVDVEEYRVPMGFRSSKLHEILAYVSTFWQRWTYHDMSVWDIEATFDRIASLTMITEPFQYSTPMESSGQSTAVPSGVFRPICIGFSQGSATFLLGMAFRQRLNEFLSAEGLAPCSLIPTEPLALILFSPPIVVMPHNSTPTALFEKDTSIHAAQSTGTNWSTFKFRQSPGPLRHLRKTEEVGRLDYMSSLIRNIVTSLMPADRQTAFFFYLARRHMGLVSLSVETISTLLPNSIFPYVGHFFVRDILGFYTDNLSTASRRWLYPLTPSGLTSYLNMNMYMRRIESGEPLGNRFGEHIQWPLAVHRDARINTLIEDHISDRFFNLESIRSCSLLSPIFIWFGASDNIAWPEVSAEAILRECAWAEVDRIKVQPIKQGKRPLLKRPNHEDAVADGLWDACRQGTLPHEVKVRIVDSLGHLDFVWGSNSKEEIYPLVWNDLERVLQ